MNLCHGFRQGKSVEPVVFALRDEHTEADCHRWDGVSVQTFEVTGSRKFGYARRLVAAMADAELDILHLQGIWMYPSVAASAWHGRTGKPFVISPHGMMDPWILGRGRVRKYIATALYERRSWNAASALHALNEQEAGHIRDCVPEANVIVMPNPLQAAAWNSTPRTRASRSRRIVYLGRLHPKKNVLGLLQAWRATSGEPAVRQYDYKLVVAGWGEQGYVDEVRTAAESLQRDRCDVEFLGPVYGEAKDELLTGADFLVLPSFGEGLPMTVVEAWARGTPTIMSAQCNLPMGFSSGCAIETGTSPDDIARALSRAVALPDEQWLLMSGAGVALSRRLFDPEILAQRWAAHYLELMT